MNDPIKEFIEQNRSAFDDLEAPVFNLEGFKARINPEPKRKTKVFSLYGNAKWLVAASILIAVGTTFFFLKNDDSAVATHKIVQKIKPVQEQAAPLAIKQKENNNLPLKTSSEFIQVVSKTKHKTAVKQPAFTVDHSDLFNRLTDSTSASTRLAAILDIEKTGAINNSTIDMLYKTLNEDGNSNVRLAALGVMEKYSYDSHVSALLVRSLNTQNDPMVQLGLVNLLGKMKNLDINNELYALANNPNTFNAVKDEAYILLLKEDKL
ncbi:hypothetical protein [Pedobacter nototheniae]|uniref:hypothetical protein n=1 Tax=Pedobacter nototheniae TaxID=2488994 RepID=UPI00292E5858|nr:hypothetical protein [Pedobacter nototheniae]